MSTLNDTLPRYGASGFFRATTIPLLLAGAAVGCGVAWVYQLLMNWIPFIYLNVLIAVGLGFGLGMAATMAIKAGHCRNRLLAALFAVPVALAPIAASHYWGYRSFLGDVAKEVQQEEGQTFSTAEIAEKIPFQKYLEIKRETGWTFSRHGSGGAPIKGVFVWIIWAIEAGIVLFFVLTIAWKAAGEPYCERCGAWCGETSHGLPGRTEEQASQVLSSRNFGDLAAMAPPAENDLRGLSIKLTLYQCASCRDTGFVTVEKVTLEGTGNKKKEKKSMIAEYVTLDGPQRERLASLGAPAEESRAA